MEKLNLILGIAMLGLVLIAGVLAWNAKATTIIQNGNAVEDRGLTVQGTSKITVAPDEAEISFRIVTEGKTAIEAQDKNKEASNNVMKALKGRGLKDSELESVQYSVQRQYDYSNGKSRVIGYEVHHVIKATTKDLDNAGQLVDTGVSAGANSVDNIQFGLTDEKEAEVRSQALKAAGGITKEKAQALASSLGLSLGKIKTVSESSVSVTPYFNRGFSAVSAMESKADAPTDINPEQLEVSASITAVYEIQ